ncbi:MAG: site-2 protease family protein [Pirellulaceae bacterium]
MTEGSPHSSQDGLGPDASSGRALQSGRHADPVGERQHAGDEDVGQADRNDDRQDEYGRHGELDKPPQKAGSQPLFGPRRRRLPIILLLLTVASTFWVGASQWMPMILFTCFDARGGFTLMPIRREIVAHWQDGLIYSACVLGILLTHEMGHFLATLRYRIPASFPFCIPFPISPIGTMGAVIAMDGRQADRKELFDIGLAGPLAGLVIAAPVMWIGIQQLDVTDPPPAVYALESPLGVRLVLDEVRPPGYEVGQAIPNTSLNPFFMAGWVGLLITGLNMLPVSQLDGGHVIYALLGKWAHWVARALIVLAIAWSVYHAQPTWVLMIGLVLLIGTDHPPTRDDRAPLGWFRIVLGVVSLAIPILCFSPMALTTGMGG